MFSLNRQVEVTQLMTQLPNQYNRSDSLKLVFEKRKTNRVFCITTNRLLKKPIFYTCYCVSFKASLHHMIEHTENTEHEALTDYDIIF